MNCESEDLSAPQLSNPLPDPRRNDRLGLAAAGTTALCWSFLALILKYNLTYTSSENLSWFRLFFSAICLQSYFLLRGRNPLPRLSTQAGQLLWAGGFLALNYPGYIKGIEYTSPSHAQIMIQGARFCRHRSDA